jgi:hypothetical protein
MPGCLPAGDHAGMKRLFAAAVLALTASIASAGLAAPMHAYDIVDPVLGMPAWTLALPAGWKADGTMMGGSSCSNVTSPVYKASSADGRTGADFLPRVDWAWGPGAHPKSDCAGWSSPLSAKKFLAYVIAAQQVHDERALPVPPPSATRPGASLDQARELVQYYVGSQKYDAVLEGTVSCSTATMAVVGETHTCTGLVRKWYGPSGTVVPNLPMFEAIRLTLNQAWMTAWSNAMVRHFTDVSQRQTQALLAQGDLAAASRMHAHQQFMASQAAVADDRARKFAASQYRKQSNNDNFVDYVLDCTRFYNSEGTFRVSGTNCPNRQTF